jgi:hypothetical protein
MRLAKAEAIYRPNILINGDFQVWQRGDSVSVATSQKGYTADRWLLQNNRTDVPITAYRIYDGSENPTIQQYYESYGSGISALTVSSARFLYLMDIEEAKKYEGKTVVLSYSLNKEITVNEPYTFTITETDKTNGYVQCFYRLMGIGEVLNWVKLEVGSVATPFIPRLYAEELALCQYYARPYSVDGLRNCYYGNGDLQFRNEISFEMRSQRTISEVSVTVRRTNSTTNLDVTTTALTCGSYFQHRFSHSYGSMSDAVLYANYFIDAEIY